MPMLKSPLSTPPAPLSLHEEKQERKKEKEVKRKQKKRGHLPRRRSEHEKSDNSSYLQREDFPSPPIFFFLLFFQSYIGRTSLKNNAHTKDTHLHSIFLTLSLSCKANKQQHSTRKLRTQVAGCVISPSSQILQRSASSNC